MLLLLGVRIDALEGARSDPVLTQAAQSERSLDIDVTLRGFPKSVDSANGAAAAWVPATADASGGAVPVVLWCDDIATSSEESARWAPGTQLHAVARVVALDPGSTAAFGLRVAKLTPADDASRPGGDTGFGGVFDAVVRQIGEHAAHLRLGLRDLSSHIAGAQLVPGLAVGDTSLVSEQLRTRMQESSLTHLVAVSGANCALVVSAIAGAAGRLGVLRRGKILLAGAALAGFVVIVGPDPSLQRAAVMAAVVLISSFGGKRALALPGLGVAVLALLIADPWQALQPGFALSVAATAGILLWVPDIASVLGRVAPIPAWIHTPVAVAIAAQFACGPLLLLVQPGFPAAGLLANVMAAPAAPWGTGLGLLAMLAAPLNEPIATCCAWLASFAARWIAATAEVTSALPGARWAWPGGWEGAVLLAGVEAAVLVAWWLIDRRFGERGDVGNGDGIGASGIRGTGYVPWQGTLPHTRRVATGISVLMCGAAGVFLGPTLIHPATERMSAPSDWSVVACDVGQGDAVLLRDPATPSEVMLVDTGDAPELLRACLDRFGVRRIALLVLTHDDHDHVGALGEVATRTDSALVAPNNREDGDARAVLKQLAVAGIPTRIGSAGESEPLGGMSWQLLAPKPDAVPADTNSASLVLRVQAGEISVLLLADTGEDEQRALRAANLDAAALDSDVSSTLLSADVLKIAHHGSADHDPALFQAVGADVGLVSVGADNSYGHPSAPTIEHAQRAGTEVYRTDRSGSIAVSGAPGAILVWAARSETGTRAEPTDTELHAGGLAGLQPARDWATVAVKPRRDKRFVVGDLRFERCLSEFNEPAALVKHRATRFEQRNSAAVTRRALAEQLYELLHRGGAHPRVAERDEKSDDSLFTHVIPAMPCPASRHARQDALTLVPAQRVHAEPRGLRHLGDGYPCSLTHVQSVTPGVHSRSTCHTARDNYRD